MPFDFVCPFCYQRTRVGDEFLGQGGPCAGCGKHVIMPTRNAQGALIQSVQTGISARPKSLGPTDPRSRWWRVSIVSSLLFVFGSILFLGGWFGLPAIQRRLEVFSQGRDIDNLKSIAEGLNAYQAKYGTYPTPDVTDATGKKLLSWRVLILPFIGYEDLYKRFQLDQAWDSPANSALVKEMPAMYGSPNSDDALDSFETNYVLLTGAGTLFPIAGPMSRNAVTDKPTLLVVETTNGGRVWTQPGDIDIGLYGIKVGTTPMQSIGGLHPNHVMAVDTDENELRIPKATPQIVLDALVTPANGEKISKDAFGS